MGVNLSEYKSLFIQTANELALQYGRSLSILKKDISNKAEIDVLFRTVHSLKSQSLFMNYMGMGEYCMKLETLLYPFRNGLKPMPQDLLIALPDKTIFLLNLRSIENEDREQEFDDLKLPLANITI